MDRSELALRAALLEPDEALKAWNSLLSSISFDELTSAQVRVLPAIYRNIGSLESPISLDRLKGSVRYTWAKNATFLAAITPVALEAEREKVNYRIVKGGALNLLYGDLSLRSMGDLDVLVSEADASKFQSILERAGFTVQFSTFCSHVRRGKVLPELNYINPAGIQIDLHIAEHRDSAPFFRSILRAEPHICHLNGSNYAIPSTELLVLHAIHHGKLAVAPSDSIQGLLDLKELLPLCDEEILIKGAASLNQLETLVEFLNYLYAITNEEKYQHLSRKVLATRTSKFDRKLISTSLVRIRRGASAMLIRHISLRSAWSIWKGATGHRSLYTFWVATGKLRPLERIITTRIGGFLRGERLDALIIPKAQEIRFSARGSQTIVIESQLLDRDEFLLFGNGLLQTTFGAKGEERVEWKTPVHSQESEYSIRLSRSACYECAKKLNQITVTFQ